MGALAKTPEAKTQDANAREAAAGEMPLPVSCPAVVEVRYGGICGSDLHYWLHGAAGESVLKAPLVLGPEIVGVVARAADGSLHISPVITHEFPLSQGLAAFEVARNSADSGKVLLDFGTAD